MATEDTSTTIRPTSMYNVTSIPDAVSAAQEWIAMLHQGRVEDAYLRWASPERERMSYSHWLALVDYATGKLGTVAQWEISALYFPTVDELRHSNAGGRTPPRLAIEFRAVNGCQEQIRETVYLSIPTNEVVGYRPEFKGHPLPEFAASKTPPQIGDLELPFTSTATSAQWSDPASRLLHGEFLADSKGLLQTFRQQGSLASSYFDQLRRTRSHLATGGMQDLKRMIGDISERVSGLGPSLERLPGVQLVCRVEQMNGVPQSVIKKCLVFGNITAVVLHLRPPRELWGPELTDLQELHGLIQFAAFCRTYEDPITEGVIVPIPVWNPEWQSFGPRRGAAIQVSGFADELRPRNAVEFVLSHSTIQDLQLTTGGYLALPSLTNARVGTILKLRHSEYNSFLSFQKALAGLLSSNPAVTAESALRLLVAETHDNVRILDGRVQYRRRYAGAKHINDAVSAITLLVLAFAYPDLQAPLLALLSGTSLNALLTQTRPVAGEPSFRETDFFYPWLLYNTTP